VFSWDRLIQRILNNAYHIRFEASDSQADKP